MKARVKAIIDNRWLIFALRVALGGIFIAASVSKLLNQAEFINIVTSYGILPDSLARLYALVIPWAELAIGCSLVLGIFSRFAAALSIPLIVSFIIASAYSLFHPIGDACGCFGQTIPLSHSASLAIDAVMLLIAVQLLLHKYEAEFLSIGPLLSRLNLGLGRRRFILEKGSKFAIVALAVLVIGMPLAVGAQSSNGIPNPDNSIDSMIDSALASGKPAFLVFYEDCLPCQVNQVEVLEQEDYYENHTYGDLIAFIYISNEEDPQAVEQFGVDEFPAMFLITAKNGEGNYTIAYQRSGSVNETELREAFDQVLEGSTGGEQSSIDSMIDSALASGKPAFLVFYEDCLPCQVSQIEDLEQEPYDENHTYGDLIAFIYISSEEDPQAADEFGVDIFPAMFLITAKNGEGNYTIAYQRSGSVNTTELREAFNQVLGGGTGGEQSSIDLMIDSALDSDKPAFLLFYEGCLPCQIRSQLQIIDDLALEYGDRIAFIRVNITQEDNPQAVKDEFNVSESPTMLLITGKDEAGYVVYQRFYTIDKETLKQSFDQVLAESIGSD